LCSVLRRSERLATGVSGTLLETDFLGDRFVSADFGGKGLEEVLDAISYAL
jgi:hypothetical protein